jgi:hypothetical protein
MRQPGKYPPDKTVHRLKIDGPPIEGRPSVPMTCLPTKDAQRMAGIVLGQWHRLALPLTDRRFLNRMLDALRGPND